MKTSKDIEEQCRKLKPVIGDQADKLWHMYLAEDERGRKEVALDIEIVAEKLLKKETLSKQEILLDPPSPSDASGSILLGDVIYNDKKLHPLYLRPEDFTKQIGIFAITGEGKTNLAYLMALQLLKSKTPFLVIDWKRSWRNLLTLKDKVPELENVRVFTVGRDTLPFLWNPFRAPPGADRELWIGTIAEALEKSHISGPGVAHYFNRIYAKLYKSFTQDFYPNFFDGKREIENMKAYQRELNWKQTALRIFTSFTLGAASKAFNTRDPIKLEDLLDKPVILELDLEMPKPLRVFFSEIILRWIHLYRLSQGETEKLRHVLFLEEAHNLFSDTGMFKDSNSLENVYREIRAFGQGIVSITQHPSLLPIYLLGNCHTQVYLGLQHADDIRTARKSLFLKYDEEAYPNMLNVGECIIKIKNRIEPCLVKTPLVPVKKGIVTDDWLRVNTPAYLSHVSEGNRPQEARYLPPHNNREDGKGKHPPQKTPETLKGHHRLLVDILIEPLSGITERYKRLKLNPKYGNMHRNRLVSEGCIRPRKIITNRGWITLFDLTQKGKALLRDLGHKVENTREGIVHKFWKHRIAEYYKSKGLKVLIEEYYVNGRPDITVLYEDKKVAVEIETGKSDAIGNIQKRLEAGFDEVICVATGKEVEEKIREELKSKNVDDEKIKVTNIFGFDI